MPRTGNRFYSPLSGLVAEARRLYAKGLSGRQIASIMSVSKSWVAESIVEARGRSIAGVLRQPPTSTRWRSTRAASRKVWERHNELPIPPGHHIHHKDGDPTNTKLDNLQLMSATEHIKLHHAQKAKKL